MSAADWQPGDPLYARSQYREHLFNFREDSDDERCACSDAASWPTPKAQHDLGLYLDEVHEYAARHRRSSC